MADITSEKWEETNEKSISCWKEINIAAKRSENKNMKYSIKSVWNRNAQRTKWICRWIESAIKSQQQKRKKKKKKKQKTCAMKYLIDLPIARVSAILMIYLFYSVTKFAWYAPETARVNADRANWGLCGIKPTINFHTYKIDVIQLPLCHCEWRPIDHFHCHMECNQ